MLNGKWYICKRSYKDSVRSLSPSLLHLDIIFRLCTGDLVHMSVETWVYIQQVKIIEMVLYAYSSQYAHTYAILLVEWMNSGYYIIWCEFLKLVVQLLQLLFFIMVIIIFWLLQAFFFIRINFIRWTLGHHLRELSHAIHVL